jgi:putative membrane protein
MSIIMHLGLLLGILLLIALVLWQGAVQVFDLLLSTGWSLLWLPPVWMPNMLASTQAWRYLFRQGEAPGFLTSLQAMWIGRAVNDLLPVATLGGEVVKARLITLRGCPGITASASVIVDKTVQVVAVILWGLTGVALLLSMSLDNDLAMLALAGFSILTLCTAGFFLLQRAGMFSFLAHLGGKLVKTDGWENVRHNARQVDTMVYATYDRRSRFVFACLLKTTGLAMQSTEVWLGCYLLGYPVSVAEALMIRSLTSTMSDFAFIIPNAYGVQEGAFIITGSLIGMPPEAGLALSLALRIRDILLDPAGLLALHHIESKYFMQRSSRTGESTNSQHGS